LIMIIACVSCNNDANNSAASSDSTAKQDTIKSEPSTFSDPH
jgi:hypothetical protein